MRSRRLLLTAVALTVLGLTGCGDDASGDQAASAPVGSASASPGPVPTVSAPAAAPSTTPTTRATPTTSAPSAEPGTGTTPGRKPTGSKPATKGGKTPGARPTTTTNQLSATGLGPYQEGTTRKKLTSAGLLTDVKSTKGCPDFVVATGLDEYQAPSLVFYQGKLQYIAVTSPKTTTVKGARVGMTAAEVKARHAGKQLDDWVGATAWFATAGKDALLFRFADDKVERIEAGLAEPLQFRFTDGEGC